MPGRARRPLSSGAIIAITLASTFGLLLVVAGLVVSFVAIYISAYTVHPTMHRFVSADAPPTCTVSRHTVVITYPIGDADPAYKDEVDWARPDQLQGFAYVDVTTSPAISDQVKDSDPDHKDLALRAGTILVMTLKATSPSAMLDGIHLEWSWGETGGTQVLPLHVRLSGGRCVLG